MVYQGTALGPPLWNICYEDASMAIRCHGFCEIVFADDLNAYKAFEFNASNEELFVKLQLPKRGARLGQSQPDQLRRD